MIRFEEMRERFGRLEPYLSDPFKTPTRAAITGLEVQYLVGMVERMKKMGSRLESHLKNRTDCCAKCFAEPCMQCSGNNTVLAEWAILLAELEGK